VIVTVACGALRDTLVRRKADATHLGALGVLQVDCLECGGDGDWGKFVADNAQLCRDLTGSYPYVKGSCPCVDCKGTGKVYING